MSKPALQLLRVELTALAILAGCAAVFAAFTIFAYLTPDGYLKPADEMWGQATLLSITFFLFGLLPVSLYGAPAYLALGRRGCANWQTALGVGLVPGVLFFFVDRNLGLYSVITGAAVSLLTHALCRKWL